jgi:hypothetical protein
VISNLNRFVTEYEDKLSSFGFIPQTIRSLKKDYEELECSGDDQRMQTMVDDVILSLLPILFSSNVIKTFDLEDISKFPLFGFEKIEKDNAHGQILAKMKDLIK